MRRAISLVALVLCPVTAWGELAVTRTTTDLAPIGCYQDQDTDSWRITGTMRDGESLVIPLLPFCDETQVVGGAYPETLRFSYSASASLTAYVVSPSGIRYDNLYLRKWPAQNLYGGVSPCFRPPIEAGIWTVHFEYSPDTGHSAAKNVRLEIDVKPAGPESFSGSQWCQKG